MTKQTKIIIFCVLIGCVTAIGALHSFTPGHMIFYHDSYRRLAYFPIAIGAVFFGLWGGVVTAVASCLAFVPHLLLSWVRGPEAYYSELSEIIFYLAAGVIIGLISSKENQLREKYKKLSEQLTVSYKRLHDQAERLVKAEKHLGRSKNLEMLGQVSANLAHEIKNPLASIKGAAEILSEEMPKAHPKYEFVKIMKDEILRLNMSVEDVLSYCRGQQLKQKIKKAPIEKIVERVILMLDTPVKEKHIDISVKKDSQMGEYSVDEAAMTQVLVNILINAVEAAPHKGKIEFYIRSFQEGCLVTVSDNGPGIDDHKKEDVFHSFVTFKEGGTGIGLSISKKMVNSLGGRISVETSALGGAKICLFLPAKTKPLETRSFENV